MTFQKVLDLGLNVMDTTAFTMCQENNMPIIVFDINKESNLMDIINGKDVGTKVIKR